MSLDIPSQMLRRLVETGESLCFSLEINFNPSVFQLLLCDDREEVKRRSSLNCKDESVRRDEDPVSDDRLNVFILQQLS